MRPIEWNKCITALALIMESPEAEKGYEDLREYFRSNELVNEAEAVDFLLKEKFHDNSPDID